MEVRVGNGVMGKDFKYSENMFKIYVKKPLEIKAMEMLLDFEVDTLEGTMKGKAGDYLVCGIQGEYYPVDKDIFKASYERVK